jgi:hypothetical protein
MIFICKLIIKKYSGAVGNKKKKIYFLYDSKKNPRKKFIHITYGEV